MLDFLTILLRIAGGGLLLLTVLHVPISRHLGWREDCGQLTPVNASIFRVHAFFICLVLALMGAACVIEPSIFLTRTAAGSWICWSFAVFWTTRLYFQWFVYETHLWRGKRLETWVHGWFTFVWAALSGLFLACGAVQVGWLR